MNGIYQPHQDTTSNLSAIWAHSTKLRQQYPSDNFLIRGDLNAALLNCDTHNNLQNTYDKMLHHHLADCGLTFIYEACNERPPHT